MLIKISNAAKKNIDWYEPTAHINKPNKGPIGVMAEENRLKEHKSHFFIVFTAAATKVL